MSARPAHARGLLLVLEGAEGVGKTTQVAALLGRLSDAGFDVRSYREPGGTSISEPIRALLLDPEYADITPAAEALLFMAARAQLMARVRADLAVGRIVLLDRFFLSTYAYQVAGRGLPESRVRAANALAVGELVPDLTLLLVCDLALAQGRMRARGDLDRMERAGDDFHARVTAGFLAAGDPIWQAAHPEVGPIVRIEADGSVEQVAARIDEALAGRWPETFRALVESKEAAR